MKNRTLLTIALALFAFGCADDPALGGPTGPDPADTLDVSPVDDDTTDDTGDDTTDDTDDETGDAGMGSADLPTAPIVWCCFCVPDGDTFDLVCIDNATAEACEAAAAAYGVETCDPTNDSLCLAECL